MARELDFADVIEELKVMRDELEKRRKLPAPPGESHAGAWGGRIQKRIAVLTAAISAIQKTG